MICDPGTVLVIIAGVFFYAIYMFNFFVKDFYILPRCTEGQKRGHCTISENPTFFLRHTQKT